MPGQKVVSLDKFESPLNVAQGVSALDTLLTIEQILKLPNDAFAPIGTRDFGKNPLKQRETWLKVDLAYDGNVDVKRVLTSTFSRIDTISYYLIHNDSILQYKKGGRHIRHLHNDYNYNYPLFELSLPPNFKGTLYVHLQPKSFIFFPIEFWEPKALAFHNLTSRYEEGMLVGIMCLFFISMLVFASIFKERYFWFYSLYLFSGIIYIADAHGNLWNSLNLNMVGIHNFTFHQVLALCFMLYTSSFLNIREKCKRIYFQIHLLGLACIISFFLQGFIAQLPTVLHTFKKIADLIVLFGTVIYVVYVLDLLRKAFNENRRGRYFWVLFSVLNFFIAACFSFSHLVGYVNPEQFLTELAPIFVLIETATLFSVIAFDYFEIQNKKNKADMALSLEKQNALGNLVRGAEQERERLARELHDGVGGILVALKIQYDQFKGDIPKHYNDKFSQLLNKSTQEVKEISYNLMPGSLALTSLRESIEQLVLQYRTEIGPSIELYTLNWSENFSMDYKLGIYRIVQELLKNTIEHAKASEIIVQISRNGNEIHLTVEDNGIGFEKSKVTEGMGIKNIRNRVAFLNGKIEIESYSNRGSTFNIFINLGPDGYTNY